MHSQYDPAHFETAQHAFLASSPAFESTRALDDLRAAEYGRLDRSGHIYLDYTGGGLYAISQLQKHVTLLGERVFGNPHSANPTSMAMTRLVESARRYVLTYFNASPDEYAVIFTPNASGALKLVGESFPFEAGDHYLLTFDDFRRCIDGKSSGAVRVSAGIVTNFADVYHLMQFAQSLLDHVSVQVTA